MAKRGGFPGGMPGNMNNLMKQAQRMQRQMEEATKELRPKNTRPLPAAVRSVLPCPAKRSRIC